MSQYFLIVHYLTGSRADHADILPIEPHRELLIGRAANAAIRIPAEEGVVSRSHARIRVTNTRPIGLVLEDLGSEAGTFVNQVRVLRPEVLRSGDSIRLGEAGPEFVVALEG
jgi:pSer/pThr/pTyr-binding forkhead associated (FHA) protein